jgi:uncharacterized protein YraI
MNRQTRKFLLNLVTGVAVAAAAAIMFLPAAQAAPGYATTNVNVRSGPGTGYAVVGTLARGQEVDVQRCQSGWCYVVQSGRNGWVSSSYLAADRGGSGGGFSLDFNIGGPGGPNVSIGIGQPRPPIIVDPRPPRPPVVRPPVIYEACFFERSRFRGESFCLEPGDSYRLPRWSEGIGSIENRGEFTIDVCTSGGFRDCRTYTTSASSLGEFGNYVESVRVRR